MLITRSLSDGCRQATSGTDPPYRNAPDVYTKARPFARKPTKSAVTILKGGRERVLWSKAVVGADNDAIDPRGEMYATEFFVIERAQHVTAAVEEDQRPERGCPARRGVDADREVRGPAGSREHVVLHQHVGVLGQRLARSSQLPGHPVGFDPPCLG